MAHFRKAFRVSNRDRSSGFTLIELSIVLVIIGLIIGGVLVGQDLIKVAQTRAQIAQIEKYNTAVNTFRNKYNGLPGDISDPSATSFGFVPRGTQTGQGDGNGLIVGYWPGAGPSLCSYTGETGVFWEDLSNANMVDGLFNLASETLTNGGVSVTPSSTPNLNQVLPLAKIGNGNYVYVYNGGVSGSDGINYFSIAAVTVMGNGMTAGPGLTVSQAYNIDKKVDDGLPQSGKIIAAYVSAPINLYAGTWAAGGGVAGGNPGSSVTGSSTTCYDNAGGSGAMQYSTEINNGANVTCALSFAMQGAAR